MYALYQQNTFIYDLSLALTIVLAKLVGGCWFVLVILLLSNYPQRCQISRISFPPIGAILVSSNNRVIILIVKQGKRLFPHCHLPFLVSTKAWLGDHGGKEFWSSWISDSLLIYFHWLNSLCCYVSSSKSKAIRRGRR